MGTDLLYDSLCRLMGPEDKVVPLGGPGGYKDLGLGRSEDLLVFRCGELSVLHDLFKVHADLNTALGTLCPGFRFRRQLQAHVGFVDGADIVKHPCLFQLLSRPVQTKG